MINPNAIGILNSIGSIILGAALVLNLFADISLKREVRELERKVEMLEAVSKIAPEAE